MFFLIVIADHSRAPRPAREEVKATLVAAHTGDDLPRTIPNLYRAPVSVQPGKNAIYWGKTTTPRCVGATPHGHVPARIDPRSRTSL